MLYLIIHDIGGRTLIERKTTQEANVFARMELEADADYETWTEVEVDG